MRQAAQLETLPALTRTHNLLSAVEGQIITSPTSKFRDFLNILHSEPSLDHLARKLEEAYSKLVICVTNVMLQVKRWQCLLQCCDDSIKVHPEELDN